MTSSNQLTTSVVLGQGTWGFGLTAVLAETQPTVLGWNRAEPMYQELCASRQHPLLDVAAPENVEYLTELDPARIPGDAMLVCVVPSFVTRALCETLQQAHLGNRQETLVVAAKGLELETNMTMPEVVEDVLGSAALDRLVLLSGPSHAEEVARGVPTTVVVAGNDAERTTQVQQAFMTPTFRLYTQDDLQGVALGGALKNIYAIAAGAVVGLGFGDNTLAALMTRGLAEMARLGTTLGAKSETFAGLTGLGDLIVTCSSEHSRNRRFGRLRAEGKTTDQAMAEIGMAVEGVRTCQAAWALAQKHSVDMPIIEEVYALIYEDKDPAKAVHDLMRRDPKPEDTL
jgi:glycerol-3-phosphate dehydrogenase (NAD(P)+)